MYVVAAGVAPDRDVSQTEHQRMSRLLPMLLHVAIHIARTTHLYNINTLLHVAIHIAWTTHLAKYVKKCQFGDDLMSASFEIENQIN